jgi:S-adenosylmethionine-diacylglycerol 3-amino-3-carboxypropyl transferase
MDWMSPADITTLLVKLQNQMKSGAIVLYRQLNNPIDLETEFGDSFQFDPALGNRLLEAERSLFYSSIHVGKKR